MAAEDEERAAFDDDEDDLEDTEGDDSDMDEDDDDDGGQPPAPPPPAASSAAPIQPQKPSPNPNHNPNPASDPPPAPQNGAIQALAVYSGAPGAAGESASGGDLQTPDAKRQRLEERRPPSASLEDSRRLFQRLWTDDDEIKILNGFLEFTSSRGTTFASHQYDTGPFYEQIKNELQLDFNKNQLIEKLRRLKKKYRNTANRMANHGKDFTFKSPHEKTTYDIAKKIWSASIKRSQNSDDDDLNPYANNANSMSDAGMTSERRTAPRSRRRGRKRPWKRYLRLPMALQALPPQPMVLPQPMALQALPPPLAAVGSSEGVVKVEVQTVPITTTPVMAAPIQKPSNSPAAEAVPPIPNVIEETVKSCLSPIFKELLNSTVSPPLGLGINLPPLFNLGGNFGEFVDRCEVEKQQILELEVYLKRVELVRDQIKSTLEELKAAPNSGS